MSKAMKNFSQINAQGNATKPSLAVGSILGHVTRAGD